MKKTLVSALTTALVVGAASTTFAAANPFSDVPADSWAYNAVATLARDGVVNGFPNGTFQGQKTMTRYEMAQIVAKAMAYENMTKADKAIVDKLAVEFAQELNNLGVRVSNLESKVDNVKLTGKVQYTYENQKMGKDSRKVTTNELKFQVDPSAQINKNWTAKSRLSYTYNAGNDEKEGGEVDRIYVEGNIGKVGVMAGRYNEFLANGLVFDDKLTGATVSGKIGAFDVKAVAARHKEDVNAQGKEATADVYAGEVAHKMGKVGLNAGYVAVRGLDNMPVKRVNGWYAGAEAEVLPMVKFSGEYAQANLSKKQVEKKDKRAYSLELAYRGEDAAQAGSYGVFAAYRNLGEVAAVAPTYDAAKAGQKGMEYGVAYVPAENIVTTVKYFDGKEISNDSKVKTVWARAEFLF